MNQNEWNQFVIRHNGSFLQSWEWGEFQERAGRRVFRIALKPLDAIAQCIEMPLPLGMRYWYAPRGPVAQDASALEALSDEAKKQGALFLRFDWPWQSSDQEIPRMCRKTADVQPSKNWVLHLTPPTEELFKNMHAKTRYNIGLAQQHGQKSATELRITHFAGTQEDALEIVWEMLSQTSGRHQFRLHPKSYYEEMLKIPFIEVWRATLDEKTIATHILAFFGDRVTYLHGGSSYEHRNIMAPQLLHWEAIQDAKRRGFHLYDFGGIDPDRWPGLTRFKTGFGGRQESSAGTFDVPLKPIVYSFYRVIRRLGGSKH